MNKTYYIALVGKNPLPIYITALNYINADTRTYLIYTTNEEQSVVSSELVAYNIVKAIKDKISLNIEPCLLGSIKNDFKDINKKLENISLQINKDIKNYENHITVYVDYTGATKLMAASVYRFFKEESEHNKKYTNITYRSLYVSSDENAIHENNFIFSKHEKSRKYNNSIIAEKYKVNRDNILKLHGWEIISHGSSIRNEYGEECLVPIKDIIIDGFNLTFKFRINTDNIKKLVEVYFYLADLCIKAGGSMTSIIIILDSNFPMDSEEFYNRVRNITTNKANERVELIKEEE